MIIRCTGCPKQCVDTFKIQERAYLLKMNGTVCKESVPSDALFKIEFIEKLSPNSPCFCGSGKKYKKCCMRKVAA